MTINSLQLNNSTVFSGLGTATYTVVTTGLYTIAFTSTIPHIAAGTSGDSTVTTGGSGLSVVINNNGSPLLSVTSPTPTQPITSGSVTTGLTAADVITVVMSSSAAVDAVPNAVKTTINLYAGH